MTEPKVPSPPPTRDPGEDEAIRRAYEVLEKRKKQGGLGRREDREDAAHDAIAYFLGKNRSEKLAEHPNPEALANLKYKSCLRDVLKRKRRCAGREERAARSFAQSGHESPPPAKIIRNEDMDRFGAEVEKLPKAQKAACEARVEGRTMTDTERSNFRNARKRLRDRFSF